MKKNREKRWKTEQVGPARNAHVLALEAQRSDYKDLVREQMKKNRMKKAGTLQPKAKSLEEDLEMKKKYSAHWKQLDDERDEYKDLVREKMKASRMAKAESMRVEPAPPLRKKMSEEEKVELKKRLSRHWEQLDQERADYKTQVRE